MNDNKPSVAGFIFIHYINTCGGNKVSEKFSEYASNSVVTNKGVYRLKEGIDHIESLPLDKFINAIENLENFIATEKLDGANLVFGIDSQGKLYTSREAKGKSKRYYSAEDYEINAANSGFASAHAALTELTPQLKKILDTGDAVEVEILFGRQPNAIVYGSSYIAFLKILPGDNKQHPDQSKIKQLTELMKDKTVTVSTKHVTTDDGIELLTKEIPHKWKFTSTSYIDSHHFIKVDVKDEIKELKQFLKQKNDIGNLNLTNMDIIGIKLTSVPKTIRPEVKDERQRLSDEVTNKFKLPIKEKFLNTVLRTLAPALRDIEIEEHEETGVEGVVLLNPDTLEQIKIVDKDVFTIINQFNYAIRNEIKNTSRGRQRFENVTLGRDTDIFGGMLQKIADIIGISGLGEYVSIKRILKKYIGNTHEETLENLIHDFRIQDVENLRPKIALEIENGIQNLDDGLEKYKQEWDQYVLKLKDGREIRYTNEIHKRTLIYFAEIRKEMRDLLADINKSKTIADIVVALYGKQLKLLH